jgi:hypothetical protein
MFPSEEENAKELKPEDGAKTPFLSEMQKQILEHWVRCDTSPQRLVFRCQILLLRAEGNSIKAIMRKLGCSRAPVRKWIRRWEDIYEDLQRQEALEVSHHAYSERVQKVLADAPRPGAPPKFTAAQVV